MSLLDSLAALQGRAKGARDAAYQGVLGPLLEQQKAREDERTQQQRVQALRPLLEKFGPDVAKQVGTAATSADPGAQQLGMQQLSGLLGQLDPQYKTQLAAQEQGLVAGDQAMKSRSLLDRIATAREGRDVVSFGLEKRLKQLQIKAAEALGVPAPLTDAQVFEQETGYPLPKDYIAGINPYTKQLQPMPAPNTENDRKAQAEVQSKEQVTRTITRYLAMIDTAGPTGTEFLGPGASQLRKAREDVITAWRKAAEFGTPTGGELERIESILPDPTSLWQNYKATVGATGTLGLGADYFKQSMAAPYQDLLKTTAADLDVTYKRNWWVPPTAGIRPPTGR